VNSVECPICLREVALEEDACEGDVIQCPFCKAWIRLVQVNGSFEAEKVKA
jgi:hypothetical protein